MDELVRAAQRGDAASFGYLVDGVGPGLRRFCARLAGEAGAEDLLQETLLRAFRALPGLERPERFEAWLFAIAANLARTWWRRQLRWPISLEGLALTYPDVPAEAWLASAAALTHPGPLDVVFEEREQARALQAALDSLPGHLAQVVALHYLDGLSYQEVAAALDLPLSTVKGRLFKSRQRLQKDLIAAGFPEARRPRGKGEHTMASRKTAQSETATDEEEVSIDSIRANVSPPSRIVFLKSKARERYLCFIIGVAEADAISIALQGVRVPRPMTHDLLLAGFGELGARPTRVVVSGQDGETFLARLHLDVKGREKVLDARPSDGFALAVRAGVPIFVAAEVLERSGVDSLERRGDGTGPAAGRLRPTERMRKVAVMAHQEMARFGQDRIGGEHALLGILAEGQSVAARALAAAGVQIGPARRAVAAVVGFGDKVAPKVVPAEPANPELQELMEEEAARLGDRYVGTEHLLLALLREEGGAVPRVLGELGAEPDAVRQALLAALKESATPSSPPSPPTA